MPGPPGPPCPPKGGGGPCARSVPNVKEAVIKNLLLNFILTLNVKISASQPPFTLSLQISTGRLQYAEYALPSPCGRMCWHGQIRLRIQIRRIRSK